MVKLPSVFELFAKIDSQKQTCFDKLCVFVGDVLRRIGRWSFCSWFDVKRSKFHAYVCKKRFLHFDFVDLKITSSFTSEWNDLSMKQKLFTAFQYWVNERFATDRQTDKIISQKWRIFYWWNVFHDRLMCGNLPGIILVSVYCTVNQSTFHEDARKTIFTFSFPVTLNFNISLPQLLESRLTCVHRTRIFCGFGISSKNRRHATDGQRDWRTGCKHLMQSHMERRIWTTWCKDGVGDLCIELFRSVAVRIVQ